MEGGEERTERGEGQVMMNVLLFTVQLAVYTMGVCAYTWELWLWVICETD